MEKQLPEENQPVIPQEHALKIAKDAGILLNLQEAAVHETGEQRAKIHRRIHEKANLDPSGE